MSKDTLQNSPIYFRSNDFGKMEECLIKYSASEKIFILCDTQTAIHCLPYLTHQFSVLNNAIPIEIPSGEKNKNIEQAQRVWEQLLHNGASKQSLVINLGGGMITDIGAFIATLFKRGVDFLHVPTTLLAMTDAAIGGKSAVNIQSFKNQAGVFSFPVCTYIDTAFLKTLPEAELINGYAEMLKHGIIADKDYFTELSESGDFISEKAIRKSVEIKNHIIKNDLYDRAERKLLNFGHTIGHALESFLSESNKTISHGKAVAAGMICESYIAVDKKILSRNDALQIEKSVRKYFSFDIDLSYENLKPYLLADKKNSSGQINFTLPERIGKCLYNQAADEKIIQHSISRFLNPEK
ncbi:MAG: 3-dehydroquinate synthase [Bacteroidetes bacterium]|jgi:3-dehydroquinate synthase|nr:3-dehydroquinate synthase [Bacteroidota bacterium]